MLTLLRIACRLALAAAIVALLALWVDASWKPQTRTLELRVRRGQEVVKVAQALARRAWSAARDRDLPSVSSGEREKNGDELTEEDRRLLQRLIEEKLRE
jgi:hypothetical protein